MNPAPFVARLLLFFALMMFGQQSSAQKLPTVDSVAYQPLFSQAKRLLEAMAYLGNPLPDVVQKTVGTAPSATAIQQALDPFCIAAVTIAKDGSLSATVHPQAVELHEQGWTTHLVKVLNLGEAVGSLLVTSPNAGPLANAQPDQIARRWLDLQTYGSRPLKPRLSGLEVEYRIVQLYSRDAGSKTASLEFRLSQAADRDDPRLDPTTRRTGIIREWDFTSGTDQWRTYRDIEISTKGGSLHGHVSGRDPSMGHPVTAPGGQMAIRFSAKSSVSSFGQIYWATKDRPRFDGNRRINFMLERNGGQWKDYEILFAVTNDLNAIRIDLGSQPAHVEIDWIQLAYADSRQSKPATVDLSFRSLPSQPVRFEVLDEHGQPATAAFLIEDEKGRIYPATAKRLAPDFFFHPQIYRHHGETVRLPAGTYTIHCSRGPESIPVTRILKVGDAPATFRYQVERWVDPAASGWYSGDHHIHAAGCKHYSNPTEGVIARHMARHIQGEDLKIGTNLTWGPGFDYQKQFFTGKIDPASKYPYLLRYDIEVSGFGSHRSGHLCLLRLKDQMYPGGDSTDHWPTLGLSTLKWAKSQEAITGPAHSAIGLRPTQERVPGRDGPNGLPNHLIPEYTGIGANEYIVDITHQVPGPDGTLVPAVDFISTMDTDRTMELNMWYHTLNCDFRVRASGETDFPCLSGERVGKGRVYVKVDGQLDYDKWCEGIRSGRSYISDGTSHLMDFSATTPTETVSVGGPDGEIKLEQTTLVKFTARVSARTGTGGQLPVELIVNSYPVARQLIHDDGREQRVHFEIPLSKSSWVALRIFPSSHTNPIFVTVDGKPVRSPDSARWFLKGIDNLWRQKQWTYAQGELEDAKQAYAHAQRFYRNLVSASD